MDIEIPEDTLRAAGMVASSVSFESIFSNEASFVRLTQEPIVQVDLTKVKLGFKDGQFNFDQNTNELRNEITLTLECRLKENDSLAFKIEARYITRYKLTTNPPPEEMRDMFFGSFVKTNGLFHIWPYWRELIQTACGRMGIPNVALPVLKFVPEQKGKIQKPEASLSKKKKSISSDKSSK